MKERVQRGPSSASPRAQFADLLRGPAALIVIAGHYLATFWDSHKGIAIAHLGVEPLGDNLAIPEIFLSLAETRPFLGTLGVSLFFLTSGYVIPLALHRHTLKSFVAGRFLRLFPVYWCGLAILVSTLLAVALLFDGAPKFAPENVLAQATIIAPQYFGLRLIDPVTWTLQIEIYFYALCAFLFIAAGQLRLSATVVVQILLCAIVCALLAEREWRFEARQFMSLAYMLLGTQFLLLERQGRSFSLPFLLSHGVGLCVIGLTFYLVGDHQPLGYRYGLGFVFAYGIFVCAWLFRRQIRLPALTKHFSAISYPLYVIHSIFGYALMYSALRLGLGPWAALGMAIAATYSLSILVHVYVERPTMSGYARAWVEHPDSR